MAAKSIKFNGLMTNFLQTGQQRDLNTYSIVNITTQNTSMP